MKEKCISILREIESAKMRFRPKSNDLIEKAGLLSDSYLELDVIDRFDIRGMITQEIGIKLLSLSTFCAEEAINSNNYSWVKSGIVLHIMEGFRVDYRENIRRLVLLRYSSESIGADFSHVCNEVLFSATEEAKNRLEEFLRRPEELNDPRAFGIKVVVEKNRTKFVSE